ncbi:Sodium:neurotransmitter symporter family protein [Hoylesella saccharolytica F0055]|uniref:Sodium:neurotransmitter symporter family protein n=1 Tax=Hoylesella saccharolytica F0055 TaxID=1127699 RepID=L1NJJ1_9BACT|nr:sodium-dependent transporter [Hoylesella saccharolytica]EKY03548.1 Sodium:neurotransmitter symporter family protein [Hoylesella saccharolytica F0055]
MSEHRIGFGSKLGMILATAGSAVGLGNVWRFPYMTGADGGAVFILIYLACIVLLGIPCMVSEFIIGRHGAANTARAYEKMSAGKGWKYVGLLGVATAFLITGYYAVVSGWCLQYLYASSVGQLQENTTSVSAYFSAFSTDPIRPVLWTVVILLLTHFVIIHGVRGGIERASKFLMPVLFILLLVIVGASCMLPNADKGMVFLFQPDFSKLNTHVFLDALGQSFYSLSIAMGCICTYASYFSRQTHLMKSAVQISIIDSLVAILAGLMIFPAAFSVGINPDSGPSLLFITLPQVFQQAFSGLPLIGYVLSLMFYALLTLAALTSLISLHEVSTAYFYEQFHITRKQAAWLVTICTCIIGAFCSLSLGAVDGLQIAGRSLFSVFDFVTGQIFLPVGGFLTCLFLGWFVPRQIVKDEFTNWGTLKGTFFKTYLFSVRYVCPLCILLIFLHQFGVL